MDAPLTKRLGGCAEPNRFDLSPPISDIGWYVCQATDGSWVAWDDMGGYSDGHATQVDAAEAHIAGAEVVYRDSITENAPDLAERFEELFDVYRIFDGYENIIGFRFSMDADGAQRGFDERWGC